MINSNAARPPRGINPRGGKVSGGYREVNPWMPGPILFQHARARSRGGVEYDRLRLKPLRERLLQVHAQRFDRPGLHSATMQPPKPPPVILEP